MKIVSGSGAVVPTCIDSSNVSLDDMVMDALLLPNQYYYQPIVDVINESVVGFEMLSRAEIKGIQGRVNISTLSDNLTDRTRFNFDMFSLKHAITTISKYKDKSFYLSVNIEPEHIIENYFISHVRRLMSDEKISNIGHRIVLEITERSELKRSKSVIDNIDVLTSLGFCLSIDDFGTGFSNLALFTWLKPDYIKIDGIFVEHIGSEGDNPELLKAIISLSHGVGSIVIAERIETELQLDQLKERGVQFCQGYYLGKPHGSLISKFKIV
ncbi:MAG: EAL domain-containing protein [Saccharospirillaceae bacterium]|nr:EAL domain-containing protein [Saccharospirillaceae bacterium]